MGRAIGLAAVLLAATALWAAESGPPAAAEPPPLKVRAVPVAPPTPAKPAQPAAKPAAPAAKPAEAAKPVEPAAKPAEPAVKSVAAAASSDAQFFCELGFKDAATADDVVRALVILVSEGREAGADFEAGKAYLGEHGNVCTPWLARAKAGDPVAKGELASLVCRTLDIKGGLWMHLLGPIPRAALKECAYLGLMAPGAEYQTVTGGELVGVIDRADRLRLSQAPPKAGPAAAPAAPKEGKP